MFGRSFLSALGLTRGYRLRRLTLRVACAEQIEAQLDALVDELLELIAPGREGADLDAWVGHACARIEEWTA